MQSSLTIFIEGDWDRIFFETFINPYLYDKYGLDEVKYIEFSEGKKGGVDPRAQLKAFLKAEKTNFLLCPDLDTTFSLEKRKEKIHKLLTQEFKLTDEEDIRIMQKHSFVVVQEIESWYLAGFDATFCGNRRLIFHPDTTKINKTHFKAVATQRNITPSQLRDILTSPSQKTKFSIQEAAKRNKSFCVFLKKVHDHMRRFLKINVSDESFDC